MISKTNKLIDNPHNISVFNHVKVDYGSLVVALDRKENATEVTIMANGNPLTINHKGEISHYLTLTAKHDFERLLRNYTLSCGSVKVFNDEKFIKKFYSKIYSVY